MTVSLFGLIGALAGIAAGYLNFRVIIGILEPRLRALDKSASAAERGGFERKLLLLRRIFLTLEIVILGTAGYLLGAWLGS
jgi:hypothetical protein